MHPGDETSHTPPDTFVVRAFAILVSGTDEGSQLVFSQSEEINPTAISQTDWNLVKPAH
jgi:hypothetical protein